MSQCHQVSSRARTVSRGRRQGLTLIEVVVAMLVLTAGGLAIAGSAAAVARQFVANERRARAVAVARARAEQTHSKPCGALSSGSESLFGIQSAWSVGSGGSAVTIEQIVTRRDSRGVFAARFLSGVACD